MKNIIAVLFAFTITANHAKVAAQEGKRSETDSLSSQMKKIAKPESKPNWIKFKEDININPATIFIEFKEAFALKENDKMVILEKEKDDLGFTHYQYQQYYKNIKIDEGTYTVHTNKNGVTYAANGKILTGLDIDIVPAINPKKAVDLVLKYVSAKEYMWQSELWERDLKMRTGKSDTSHYPSPQLVIREIRRKTMQANAPGKKYYLSYKLDIYSSSPNSSQRVFIDAATGEILEAFPLQSN